MVLRVGEVVYKVHILGYVNVLMSGAMAASRPQNAFSRESDHHHPSTHF
jgi:hypothetical protein